MKFDFPDEDIMTLDNNEEIRPYTDLNKDPYGLCNLMGHLMHLITVSTMYLYLHRDGILLSLPDFASTVRTTWQSMKHASLDSRLP